MLKKFVLVISILLISLFFVGHTKAADSTGLVVSPPLKEIETNRSNSFTDNIKLTNPTENALKISISIQDFAAQGEEGGQIFLDPETDNQTFSLAKWVTTENNNFSLNPGETKEVKYTIKVPENAEPGGHYGVIFFTPQITSESIISGSGTVVVPKIGTLLLVSVPGDIKYRAEIASFSTNKKLYLNSKNIVDFIGRFENLSSVHVKPQGTITIKNALGKKIASLTVNDKNGNVLPNSIRKFQNDWEKKYGFGWYKADLKLVYGNAQTATANLIFWIIPWKETLGAVIILLVLIWMATHIRWKK
ncbi:MAG: DUF916 domain-containing protein [Patescibacteria group bacterium]|nr:DUF916 domain-containing protein [Patescibacteria group bacterium]